MQPPHQHPRIDLDELKTQIVKKLGPEGSKQYFYYLQRFLGLKLSKVDFNKLCVRILGRENIPLHNQLIRSILKNACSAKTPPLASHKDDVLKHVTHIGGRATSAEGCLQNGSHISTINVSGPVGLSNGGDMLPVSPRKARTGLRDRRSVDRLSALGPNTKTSSGPQLSTANQSNDFNVFLDQPNGSENLVPHSSELPVVRRSPDDLAPVYSKDQSELVVRNDTKEVSARSPLRAPLGVPLCSVSIGGAQRAIPPASSSKYAGTFDDGALLDSHTLREQMEQIAVGQGLEGVSVDCANILNHGLDSYLKGLIRSCIELVGARSGHELTKNSDHKHHTHTKLINGVKPGYQYHMQNIRAHSEVQEPKLYCPISLQDFRVAMELNPRQLGEDWPLLLEKICTHAFEE